MAGLDGHDVADLGGAEQGGNAGHQVFAEGGRWSEHMRITGSEAGHLRRQNVGNRIGVGGIGNGNDFRNTGDLCRLCRDGIGCIAQHDDIDRFGFHRLCAGDATGSGGIQLAVQMFGNDKNLAHDYTSPFVFNAATSSATSFTMMPLLRLAGGA